MTNYYNSENFSVWIVTYNRPKDLNNTIKYLRNSMPEDIEINVVSNHSNVELFEDYTNLNVYKNNMRPDKSWGYLTRSWNQCYYMGLDKTEYIMCLQDDNKILPGWFELINEFNTYDFYSAPVGDISHIASRNSFLKVGWWDERFIVSDLHDFDYINRVYHKMKDDSSVVDHGYAGTWNSIGLENYLVGSGNIADPGFKNYKDVTDALEERFDRPRGDEWIHHRHNRLYFGKKRGLDYTGVVHCHKDSRWRDINLRPIVDELDLYPWFTSKMQKLTGKNQEFMNIPYSFYYDNDGYLK